MKQGNLEFCASLGYLITLISENQTGGCGDCSVCNELGTHEDLSLILRTHVNNLVWWCEHLEPSSEETGAEPLRLSDQSAWHSYRVLDLSERSHLRN